MNIQYAPIAHVGNLTGSYPKRMLTPKPLAAPRFSADEPKKPQSWWQGVKDGFNTYTRQGRRFIDNQFFHDTRPNALLKDAVFTVFDLETTGLDPQKNAILEICAIKYRNGQELDRYITFVKPTEPIPPEAQKVNNITEAMVKDAPDLRTALGEFVSFVGSQPLLVGHHVNFDIGFIRQKLDETGMSSYKDRFDTDKSFCTKTLSQLAIQNLPKYSGVEVAKVLGIVNDNPHRAEADVKMTGDILFKLIDRLKSRNFDSISDLRAYQGFPIKTYDGVPDRIKKMKKTDPDKKA